MRNKCQLAPDCVRLAVRNGARNAPPAAAMPTPQGPDGQRSALNFARYVDCTQLQLCTPHLAAVRAPRQASGRAPNGPCSLLLFVLLAADSLT